MSDEIAKAIFVWGNAPTIWLRFRIRLHVKRVPEVPGWWPRPWAVRRTELANPIRDRPGAYKIGPILPILTNGY
ncbi:MAG TPA: hypothetical protein ENJ82_04005 [Bacteroidetes bacterium]|nr:hypothetical protein [Bacteroidota bacterium]